MVSYDSIRNRNGIERLHLIGSAIIIDQLLSFVPVVNCKLLDTFVTEQLIKNTAAASDGAIERVCGHALLARPAIDSY